MTTSIARDVPARVSLATPPGGGGIAVIVVCGEQALRLLRSVFRPKRKTDWHALQSDSLHYGRIMDGDEVVDEVIVRIARPRGPHEVVEVNCHGGVVAAAEAMRLLKRAGAVETPPFDMLVPQLDRVQADALRLLPSAATRLAVRVLCDQINGALSNAIRELNFDDASASNHLGALVETAPFGVALTQPRRVAIIGSPNVGKSALFNALLGHDRAIVSPVPGTTRDFVDELLVLDGYPIELIDTAGVRRRGGLVEMKGVAATWRVVSEADLLIFVVDRITGLRPCDRAVIEQLKQREVVFVMNKCDLAARPGWRPPNTGWCEVSARTGDGLPELRQAILRRFPDPAVYPPGTPVVFTAEQARALDKAKKLADAGRIRETRRELADLICCQPPAIDVEENSTRREGMCPRVRTETVSNASASGYVQPPRRTTRVERSSYIF